MVKTITIRDVVFRELLGVKKKKESFSELLDRLVKMSKHSEVLIRLRGSMTFSDKERMLKEIKEKRAGRQP